MTRTQQIAGACIVGIVLTALGILLISSKEVTIPLTIRPEAKSPLYGMVSLTRVMEISSGGQSHEYLIVVYTAHEGTAQKISGWNLESTEKKIRITIPEGNTLFRQGAIPTRSPIALFPGERALISGGSSPVGISFQVNSCSPRLERFQNFYPTFTKTGATTTEGFYNDCVEREHANPQFFSPEWRVFLDADSSLFSSEHDTIILRDERGLIIAEYRY